MMSGNRVIVTGKISTKFGRLSIANKLLLGHLFLSALIVVISVFALSNLEKLNRTNQSIIRTDLPIIEASDRMTEALIAQELYGKRYAILGSQEMMNLFMDKREEFRQQLMRVGSLPDGPPPEAIESLSRLYDEYYALFLGAMPYLKDSLSSGGAEYEDQIRMRLDEIIGGIKKMSADARYNQGSKALKTSSLGSRAFKVTWMLSVFGVIFSVVYAFIITKNISGSINQLKLATKQISEGKFDYAPTIKNQDEFGELSAAFSEMAKRLKRLEEMYLDASPLTRLPGGIAIDNILNKRLGTGFPLAFCLFDLDNFKAFSDRYGYAKGSEVIKATAKIIEDAVRSCGAESDFVGHIGGDDFVLISLPDKYPDICKEVIKNFDEMIPGYYDEIDRVRGYIAGRTRQGLSVSFPIMTISIAVVTSQGRKFTNAIEIGEIAAELKEYAKSNPGSLYVEDKRIKPFHQVIQSSNEAVLSEAGFKRRMKDARKIGFSPQGALHSCCCGSVRVCGSRS